MDKIACFYYPTMVVFVDDSEPYLTQVALSLDNHLNHVTTSDPKDVLSYIKDHASARKPIDLKTTYKKTENAERFEEPSVLVMDYDIPEIDDFEICIEVKKLYEELGIPRLKIILLTGQADENTVREGFDKGYIDQYISKKDHHYEEKINKTIQSLQTSFFIEKSSLLSEELLKTPECCLHDPIFYSHFLSLCEKNRIVERYLLNTDGDSLLLKEDGTVMWFVVMTEGFSKHKEPYSPEKKEIKGKHGIYHYALVKEPDLIPIQRDNIFSFRKYIDSKWKPI